MKKNLHCDQCCGAGAGAAIFYGGSGAGADVLIGRRRELEPRAEPTSKGGSGSIF